MKRCVGSGTGSGLLLGLVFLLNLGFVAPKSTRADIHVWDGGGANDFWMTAANWNPNIAPAPGDDLEFSGGVPVLNTNNYAAGSVFGNITFSASGYVIRGNALTLTNGITLLGPLGPVAFHPDVTLAADQTFVLSRLNSSLDLYGTLNLNGFTPTFFMAGTGNVFGVAMGVGGLIQTSGRLAVHADNTWSGSATLDGGTFLVNGANPSLNANVNAGAVLGGTGSVRRIISVGGTVAPGGESAGNLNVIATTSFDLNTDFVIELNGLAPGTQHDRLITPAITLGGAALQISIGYPIVVGHSFTIINVTGGSPVTGTFGGLAEGALFIGDSMQFQITYTGGTGNDVVITAIAQQSTGVTRTWDGGGPNNLWTTAANWVGDVAPESGDSLVFPAAAAQLNNVNDYPNGIGFNQIQITSAGYNITGNAVDLISVGIVHAGYAAGSSTLGLDIRLVNFATVVNFFAGNPLLILSGDIDLGPHNLSFVCEGPITVSGVISGTGGIFKGKNPALQLSGAAPNTFTGPANILGLCELNKSPGVAAITGPLLIGNDFGATSELRLLADEQISNTSTTTVFSTSIFNLNGFDETIHWLCLTNGVVTTMGGVLTVLGGVETKPSSLISSIAGNLALGGAGNHSFTIPDGVAANDLDVSAVLSGNAAANLVKTGAGQMRLFGASPNTLAGAVMVSQGTLALSKNVNVTAIAGPLVVGNSAGGINADKVRLLVDHQISDIAPVTITSSGQLDLNNQDDAIGPLTMTAGSIITGTGLLTLAGDVDVNVGATPSLVDGRLSLGPAAARFFDIVSGATMEIGAVISGGPALTMVKTNRGELIIVNSNLFSSIVNVAGGTLTVTTNGALGNSTGNTRLTGGRLKLVDVAINTDQLVVDIGSFEGDGAGAWNGSVVLNGNLTVLANTAASDLVIFTGLMSGAGGFTKAGEGLFRIRGSVPNTFTGTNRIISGLVELYSLNVVAVPGPLIIGDGAGLPGSAEASYGGHDQIGNSAPVMILSDGLLDLTGWTDTIGSLEGVGNVVLQGGTLTIGGNNASTLFAGLLTDGVVAGNVVKVGSGILTLAGNNTYTGNTTVNGGTLLVNGQQPGSPTTVQAGAILGGIGTVGAVTVQPAGALAPGASPGILNTAGAVVFQNSTARFLVELNGTTPGISYDQLHPTAGINLGNSSLGLLLGFTPAISNAFTIINKSGFLPVNSIFNGLAEGSTFAAGGLLFHITYTGGTGNDVVVMRVPAPASKLTSISPSPSGEMQITGDGFPGLTYTLEASTNLAPPIVWTTIATPQADNAGIYKVIDADSLIHSMRFYRAVSP